MVEPAQRMARLLQEKLGEAGPSLHIAEAAGHNEAAWAAELPAALRRLFNLG